MWVTVVWLGQIVGPLAVRPGFVLLLVLVFWNPISLEGYLAQPRYSGESLGPAANNVPDFVNSLWETLPSAQTLF